MQTSKSRVCGMLLSFVWFSACVPMAHGVDVISSESRIWGSWSESGQDGQTTTGTFDLSGSGSQGVATNVISQPRSISCGASSINSFQMDLTAYSSPWWEETYGSCLNLQSSSTTLFLPAGNELQLTLGGDAQFNYSGN